MTPRTDPSRADVLCGAVGGFSAFAVTAAVLTWVITPDDGLEGLMAGPLSALFIAVATLVRVRGAAQDASARAERVIIGAAVGSALVGAVIGASDSLARAFDAATVFGMFGGGFAGLGALTALGLRRLARLFDAP